MSPRDFFKVVIKILALLVIVNGIFPALANIIPWFGTEASSGIILIAIILLFLVLVFVMLWYTDVIVDFFRLGRGYDSETFHFSNIERKYILEISAAVIGLSLIFNNLPNVLHHGFLYFKSQVQSYSALYATNIVEKQLLYNELVYIIVGIILIVSRKLISKYID